MASTRDIIDMFRLIESRKEMGASDKEIQHLWNKYNEIVSPVEELESTVEYMDEEHIAEPAEPVEPVEPVAEPAEPVAEPTSNHTGDNFRCQDFAKMVEAGFIPNGTVLMAQRKGDIYKASIQIQTLPGGRLNPMIISEADPSVNWPGGIFANPSGFALKAYRNITANCPTPRKGVNGWTALFIGSLEGPPLQKLRDAWKTK